jgi:LuxR family maltose regulon positive regulatory protein
MARNTPLVEDGILIFQYNAQEYQISVGSNEWWHWLETDTISSFHFNHQLGSFTARREQKSKSHYWYAYRRRQGHLTKAYLGKTNELHMDRLEQAARQLAAPLESCTPLSPPISPPALIAPTSQFRNQQRLLSSLLHTKFYLPPERPELVIRSQLLRQLDQGSQQKLVLISAPAGFGKTTLLSTWLTRVNQPYAWLSLDKGDNDPARFWLYVATALQKVVPAIGRDLLPLLSTISPGEALLTILLNMLTEARQRIILLLDDYHLITDQAIHTDLSFFLEHLPANTHLVIASRTDPPLPLTRLRSQGQLTELRVQDLRFSHAEVISFLHDVMRLPLSQDEITALDAHTEGWVAGLQLAAISMQGQANFSEFIAAFTGSHRYILDYLTNEVLLRQPEHIRDFLLQTSILERFSAPLCNALTNQTDGQEMLEQLERINLFLIPLDEHRQWYRYHHLFAEFLQERLLHTHPELLPQLHLRASLWHEQQQLLLEAITHALQAQEMTRALQLIEDSALNVMKNGETTSFLHWLQALPEEKIRPRLRLRLFHAGALIATGQLDQAEMSLQGIAKELEVRKQTLETEEQQADHAQLYAEFAAARSTLAAFRIDIPATISWSQEALRYLSGEEAFIRSIAASGLASAYLMSGDLKAAYETYTTAITASLTTHNLHAALASIGALGFIQVAQGHLHQALETHEQAVRMSISETGRLFPVVSMSYAGLSEIWYEWNDLDKALYYAQEGITLGKRWGYSGMLAQCSCSLAIIQNLFGKSSEALATMQQLEQLIPNNAISTVSRLIQAYRAAIYLYTGHYDQALQWANTCSLSPQDSMHYPRDREYLILTQILFADGQYTQVRRFLERLIAVTEVDGRISALISALIQLALLDQAEASTTLALVALTRAIQLAAPEGFLRIFLDKGRLLCPLLRQLASRANSPVYTLTLLQAFGETVEVHAHAKGGKSSDTLSEREICILNCLSAGKSNQEIAEIFVIAVSTVKTHLSNIYVKLGVHSRTQALVRAREIGLLR